MLGPVATVPYFPFHLKRFILNGCLAGIWRILVTRYLARLSSKYISSVCHVGKETNDILDSLTMLNNSVLKHIHTAIAFAQSVDTMFKSFIYREHE